MAKMRQGNKNLPTWPQIVEWLKQQWQTASQNWGSNVPGAATGGDVVAGLETAKNKGLLPTVNPIAGNNPTTPIQGTVADKVRQIAGQISAPRSANPNISAVQQAQGTAMPYDVDKGVVPLPNPKVKISAAQQSAEIRRRNRARRAGM